MADDVNKHSMQRWLIAIAVMSSAVMEVLDTSVVNVSLPHIAGSLSSTVDEATWVLTSYLVANAIILPISGWLATRFGRRRLLLTVVTGFTISSVLCGMAPNLPMLILFRILQGTTGGGLQPISQAVLLEEFPGEERGKAMAFWGLGIVAAPILGPTLGGWLTDAYSWRWVFYINLPVGIASVILISLYVFDPPYLKAMRKQRRSIDFWGLGMMAVGIAALQIMLDKGQEDDWFGSHFIVTLALIAAVMLTAFVIRELIIDEPIVHFRLFRYRTYASGVFLVTMLGFVLYGSLVLLPLFLQELLGYNAVNAGIWTSPRGIGTMLCMPLTGLLLDRRWDPRWLIMFGLAVASIAFFGFAGMNLSSGTWDIFWHQINQGVGMAFIFVPLTTLTMDPIPQEETGFATSIYSLMRNIGSSIGISFVTTWLARRSQFHQDRLVHDVTPYSHLARQSQQSMQELFFHHGSNWYLAGRQAAAALYDAMLQQASLMSFVDIFRIMGILFLVLVPVVLLARKPTGTKRAAGVH